VNCAISLDGRLAYAGGARARLSSQEDLVRVQRLRAYSDAILVGVGTVVQDDPSLRVHWELLHEPVGRDPTRVILDSTGRTPESARVLDGSAPTIVATSERSNRQFPPHVHTVVAGRTRVEFSSLLPVLFRLGVRRLMVEGGAEVIASVVRSGLFDRMTVYHAPVVIGGKSAPPMVAGADTAGADGEVRVTLVGVERLGEGFVATYAPRRPEVGPGP
jgi:2,5-diamino-6-(ribosylamino)-4(3H)-pyrimidinone 5'-phosphate reductase